MMRQVVVGGFKDLKDQWLIIEWTFLTRNNISSCSQIVKGDWLLLEINLFGRHLGFMVSESERRDEEDGSNTNSHWTRTFSGWFIIQTLIFFCFCFSPCQRASALFNKYENIKQLDTWVEEFTERQGRPPVQLHSKISTHSQIYLGPFAATL